MALSCVFCAVVANNDPHHEIVWQDERHLAFLTKAPAAPGHLLVIPREHTDYVFDLPEEAYGALMQAARKLAVPLKTYTGAKRIALVIDGFQVPHVHVHLVPVNHSGEIANSPSEPSAAELAEIGNELRKAYADLLIG